MQSLFLACYFCLQLIALNNRDQASSPCDECLTGLVEKFHLPSDLADEVEDLLSIKKPTHEIVMDNPALADAIAKLIQEQIAPTTGAPANQALANETIANVSNLTNDTSANEIHVNETQQQPNVPVGSVAQALINPRHSSQSRSFLRISELLKAGESLVSNNQKYLATLTNHGELVINTADGIFLEKLGCPSDEKSSEYAMLFHRSNEVRFYKSAHVGPEYYYCISPFSCDYRVRCYLNLDDDGILRFYSGDGIFEYAYTKHNSQENGTQGSSDSKEGVYKGQSTLEQKQRLKVGESLVSENGRYNVTLNHYGELETYDSDGELIRNSGTCSRNRLPYKDSWNIIMTIDNAWKLYQDMKAYGAICVGGNSKACGQYGGSTCHLKLDNDGILKMIDDKGNVISEFRDNTLDGHI